jgi:hypothetical protein
MRTLATSALGAFLMTVWTGAAHAQWPEPGDWALTSEDRPHVVFGDIGFFAGDLITADAFAMSPLVGAYFHVIPPLELGFVWGAGYMYVDPASPTADDEGALRSANPYVHAAYRFDSEALVLRVGGGLVLPLLFVPDMADADDVVGLLAVLYGGAMRGLWNPWMWSAERFSIVIPNARIDFSLHPNLLLASEMALGIMVDLSDDPDAETNVGWQFAIEGGGRFAEVLRAGLRFQLVVLFSDADDDAQLALEPFFRADFGPGYVETRLTMNLDDPLGFAFDDGKVWGLHVGGGGRF